MPSLVNRIRWLLMGALLLSACSMNVQQIFLNPTATPTLKATETITPTKPPTSTPTIPSLTFTVTPTLVGYKSPTLTPEFTATVATLTATIANTPTATVEMKGFVTAFISGSQFFKAGVCLPTSIKFTAQVADIGRTTYVLLFVRFKSRQTGATGEWADSIAMQSIGAGTYVHDLVPTEMKGLDSFKNAWVEYQFVSTDAKAKEIGRTATFKERLVLLDCVPSPTPSESVTPTPP